MSNKELVSVLTTISEMLDRSDIKGAKQLLDQKTRMLLKRSKARVKISSSEKLLDIQWDRVKSRLGSANSLEEGYQILKEEGVDKRKRYLEYLATQYTVPVRKSERINDLARRILDSAVGSRIYSDIIMNLDVGFRSRVRSGSDKIPRAKVLRSNRMG